MAIFGHLELEEIVQVNDKTRLDARKSYVTSDEAAITLVEIEPEASAGFVDITSNKYYDYQYATDGDKTVSLRITTDGSPVTLTKTLTIITEADDKLFSSDSELLPYEPGILNYVRQGRNTFLDVHRASQDRIITWLDEQRIWDVNGDRLTKDAVVDILEVNDWSKFLTLRLIFEGLSNATDDIFHEKALRYGEMEKRARERASLRLDLDGDGENDAAKVNLRAAQLVRR